MISLTDIIDFCRAEALAGKLYPTEVSDYRWFCREYSKTFHTPLTDVFNLDVEHVILCVLEEGLDSKRLKKREDFNLVVEELRRLEDPDYDANRVKEMDDFAAGWEAWEEQRQADGAPIPKKKSKNAPPEKTKPKEEPKQMPKEGGINLAYLAREEENDPGNGFED